MSECRNTACFNYMKPRDLHALAEFIDSSANTIPEDSDEPWRYCELLDFGPMTKVMKEGLDKVHSDEMFIKVGFVLPGVLGSELRHELRKTVKTVFQLMGLLA